MVTEKPFSIVFVEGYSNAIMAKAADHAKVSHLKNPTEALLCEACRHCDALLVRTYTKVTAQLMAGSPRLRVIGRAGAGLENIDLAAAKARGIQVVSTPEAATQAVADLTLGLLLALTRQIPKQDRMVRDGAFFEARYSTIGPELAELTIGIIGMGRIGRAVGRRCAQGFSMNVVYNDLVDINGLDFPATVMEKQDLYQCSDVISLHVPQTNLTLGLINTDVLNQCARRPFLINTARGGLMDYKAVARALHSGALRGAAVDVFDPEPLPTDHPLLIAPNTIFTAHSAARTERGLDAMEDVFWDVLGVLQGKKPRYPAGS